VGKAMLPDSIMAFCMNHTQNRNDIFINQEHDSVRKTVGKHPTQWVTPMANGIEKRIQYQPRHGFADCSNELSAKRGLLPLIPLCCCVDIRLNLGADPKPIAHELKRCRNRASTSSQGIEASGFLSCSARRCSMSFRSSSVNSPLSSQLPPSSSQILSRISRRSIGVSFESSAMISVLLIHVTLPEFCLLRLCKSRKDS
jgi:hypothetical protein